LVENHSIFLSCCKEYEQYIRYNINKKQSKTNKKDGYLSNFIIYVDLVASAFQMFFINFFPGLFLTYLSANQTSHYQDFYRQTIGAFIKYKVESSGKTKNIKKIFKIRDIGKKSIIGFINGIGFLSYCKTIYSAMWDKGIYIKFGSLEKIFFEFWSFLEIHFQVIIKYKGILKKFILKRNKLNKFSEWELDGTVNNRSEGKRRIKNKIVMKYISQIGPKKKCNSKIKYIKQMLNIFPNIIQSLDAFLMQNVIAGLGSIQTMPVHDCWGLLSLNKPAVLFIIKYIYSVWLKNHNGPNLLAQFGVYDYEERDTFFGDWTLEVKDYIKFLNISDIYYFLYF
jgi:hypothetical protein